jgi:hypothetical protein
MEIDAVENIKQNTFLQLADGRMIVARNNGFFLFDEASGATTTISFPGMYPESQCLQLQDGRIIAVADMTTLVPDVVIVMDTLTFTPAVACTLAANYANTSMTLLSTGEVLLVAGVTEKLNATTLAPTIVSTSPSRHSNRTILFPGDSVLVIGGVMGTTTQWYIHSTGTFVPGPIMTEARSRFGMAQLPSGDYLLAGGNSGNTSEIFDMATRTFSPGPNTAFYLGEASAVTLPSGDILFAGTEEREGYKVATGEFEVKRLNGKWAGQGLLPSGNVLVMTSSKTCKVYDPVNDLLADEPLQYLWSVSQSELDAFLADHAAGTVDYSKYRDIKSWPAHGDVAKGENYNLAPFVDSNGDGGYNPDDGDYPCITGDQSLWYVFHDDGPHTETTSPNSMGVEVEYLAYGFDCSTIACPDSFLDYTTFYHYEVTNTKGVDYHDVFIGYWSDLDLGGNYEDDYIGCDSVMNLGFIFNADTIDESSFGPGYGLHPPATGILFLNTPNDLGLTHCMAWNPTFSTLGIPVAPNDYHQLMQAVWKDSTHLVNNGADGYSGTAPGPSINHIFPGNAGWCGNTAIGWSEVTVGNAPGDRRLLMSSGPFDLPADSTITFDFATVWARGYYNDNLGSVCELRSASSSISSWWKAQNFECFGMTVAAEAPAATSGLQVFPNPASEQFEVRLPATSTADGTLRLIDLSGRLVLQQPLPKGSQQVTVSCAGIAAGLYQLHCEVGGTVHTQKVVVRRD